MIPNVVGQTIGLPPSVRTGPLFTQRKPRFSDSPVLHRILIALAVVLSLWVLLVTIDMARVGWSAIPRLDDWDRWFNYFHEHYRLNFFFEPHIDHRLAFPRLLFMIDHLVFEGRGWFLLICSFCIQGLMVFLLLRLSERTCPQDRGERIVLAAAVTAFLFSGQQWFNFILPFQVQFPMVYCAAVAALFALVKAQQHAWDIKWIAATILFATVSTYSMANGLILWPLLLIAAFWMRAPRRSMAILAISTLLIGFFYLHHFERAIMNGHQPEAERPKRIALFLLAQLGAPLYPLSQMLWDSDSARLLTTTIPGALVLLTLLGAFVVLWRRRANFNPSRAMLMFFCFFLAIASVLIAYGRSEDTPFDAFISRYVTPPHILWATLLLIAWPFLRRIPRTALYAGICAVILFLVALHQSAALAVVQDQANSNRLGTIAVVDNVYDPESWRFISTTDPNYLETMDNLRSRSLTVFTEEWTHWPGVPLLRRFSIDHSMDACQGKFEEALPISSTVKPGWRVNGWAWDNKAGRSPRYIILADDAGLVAGVALPGFPLPPNLALLPSRYVATNWSGYVGGQPRPVTAYILEADNRSICSIGTLRLRVSSTQLGLEAAGTLLSGSTPQIIGGFTPDGYYKGGSSPGPGPLPVDGPVYGSFPDANQGQIRFGPFHLDGRTELIIPLATGPAPQPLSIMVRNADTKEVLSRLSPVPVHLSWWGWHPDIPLDRELNVEIIAEDKGSDWGQWIALGWPHAVTQ